MKFLAKLRDEYTAYYSHGRPILKSAGVAGAVAFPVFYALHLVRSTHPYDNLWLRVVATLLCLGLALRDYWPEKLRRFYLAHSYVTFLYCLPFFFIYMSLENRGGVVAVANTFMAVFFLVLLTDWRNTVAMLLMGAGFATGLYLAGSPNPGMPVDYLGRLPPLILVVVGGSLFKFSQKQIQAERLDAATALAGSIAHEMRNPLGQIKHSLENMQQALPAPTATTRPQDLDASAVDELYRQLAQGDLAVKRGLQVISMTLDEVSAKPVDTSSFTYLSAAEACFKAFQEYGYESDEARARVSLQVREDFTFRGDETAFLFVLFNLIKNALYYLAEYPQAQITITVQRNEVRVRDTGPGIAADVLSGLFEPFRSVGKSGGTGLGLSYCKRVMGAFGGAIACESTPGSYTEFVLSFPPVSDGEMQASLDALLASARRVLDGKRLLLVDDDAAVRLTTRHKLQSLGAEIDEAPDGGRALQMLAAQRYDLVLADLNMPVVDGYALAARIRKGEAPANRDVTVIAHTSEPTNVASVKARRAGMDGFLVKPCTRQLLVQTLARALEHPPERTVREAGLLGGLAVLLADDSAWNRKAVAAYLKHAGVQVVEAAHGREVLQRLGEREHWDAVVMDLNMPGMGGLETARAIRACEAAWARVPIIALTAHSDEATVRAASQAGMDDFITKPVDASLLYGMLRRVTRPAPVAARPAEPVAAQAVLLDAKRLETYRRLGMYEELLDDYLPEITRLLDRLDDCAARRDMEGALDGLHSLLGMSGEAGAAGLYQMVRRWYVPMVEERRWPAAGDWPVQLRTLAAATDRALRAYGSTTTPLDAA